MAMLAAWFEQFIRSSWLKHAHPSMSTPHNSLWLLKQIDNLLSQTLSSKNDGSTIIKSLKPNILKYNKKEL